MSKAVATVKPFVKEPSPAPSIIDIVSERDDDSDDTGNENGPISMDIDASPSVEYLPPTSVEEISQAALSMEDLPPLSVEEIPQALIQEVDRLQNLSLPR